MDPVSPVSDEGFNLVHAVDFGQIPFALVVGIVALVGLRVATRSLEALGERFASRRLFFKQVAAISRFAIIFLTVFAAASIVLDLPDNVLFALGGSAAVAFGFAFKDLLASLMAGLILLFDRPFQVGDRVAFGGQYGEVVEIGLRTVRLNTLDDNLVSIPNSRFLTDVVSCANAGALDQMCVLSFHVGCNEDFELAKQILYEATATSRYVFLNKPITMVVTEGPVEPGAAEQAIRISAKAYVLDGRYETALSTDVTERVLRAFRSAGIRTIGQIQAARADALVDAVRGRGGSLPVLV